MNGDYATTFAGTSAAAPQVAGVATLMLEANPSLTWRDVKHILALTSVKNDAANPGWTTNAAGYHHHDSYGFGLADANAAATLATAWTPVADEIAFVSGTLPVNLPVPDGTGMSLTVPVYGAPAISTCVCTAAMRVETVIVNVNALHNYRGDMQILLTSPTGIQSVLGSIRNDSGNNYTNWSFSTVKNWGEYAAGTRTLQMRDGITNDPGTFVDWSLAIHGTAAVPFPQVTEITKPDAATARLTFPSQPGTAYQVFESATLAAGSWQASGTAFIATTAETTRDVAVPPLAERMFFRMAPVH